MAEGKTGKHFHPQPIIVLMEMICYYSSKHCGFFFFFLFFPFFLRGQMRKEGFNTIKQANHVRGSILAVGTTLVLRASTT